MNWEAWEDTSLPKLDLRMNARFKSDLRRFESNPKIRGRPFPFLVREPNSERTLNCCIAYNRFGAYCVPVSGLHRPAALSTLAGDVWEAPTINLITSHCNNGDIIHAGTFFGDFLPALGSASLVAGYKVWAFEPNPESYRCAAITLQLNQIVNVELINAGLGERSDCRWLVATKAGIALGGASYISPSRNDAQETSSVAKIPVRIVSIDDVVPQGRPISVIHLDVEGYEERALTGAMRMIRKYRPILILETMPTDSWISKNLLPLGYGVTEKVLDNSVLRASKGRELSVP
jgi:FkbM family methyltransferase